MLWATGKVCHLCRLRLPTSLLPFHLTTTNLEEDSCWQDHSYRLFWECDVPSFHVPCSMFHLVWIKAEMEKASDKNISRSFHGLDHTFKATWHGRKRKSINLLLFSPAFHHQWWEHNEKRVEPIQKTVVPRREPYLQMTSHNLWCSTGCPRPPKFGVSRRRVLRFPLFVSWEKKRDWKEVDDLSSPKTLAISNRPKWRKKEKRGREKATFSRTLHPLTLFFFPETNQPNYYHTNKTESFWGLDFLPFSKDKEKPVVKKLSLWVVIR